MSPKFRTAITRSGPGICCCELFPEDLALLLGLRNGQVLIDWPLRGSPEPEEAWTIGPSHLSNLGPDQKKLMQLL
jgi:hypothetical protein